MLRTTVVGSRPVANEYADRLKRYHQGQFTPQQAESLLREVARHCDRKATKYGLEGLTVAIGNARMIHIDEDVQAVLFGRKTVLGNQQTPVSIKIRRDDGYYDKMTHHQKSFMNTTDYRSVHHGK